MRKLYVDVRICQLKHVGECKEPTPRSRILRKGRVGDDKPVEPPLKVARTRARGATDVDVPDAIALREPADEDVSGPSYVSAPSWVSPEDAAQMNPHWHSVMRTDDDDDNALYDGMLHELKSGGNLSGSGW